MNKQLICIFIILETALSLSLQRAAFSGESLNCIYSPKLNNKNSSEVLEYKNCGVFHAGKVTLSKNFSKRLNFDKHGLSVILAREQYYYVGKDGTMLPVIAFDNWADDYQEGLVRSLIDGKIAYYDRSFKQIIGPMYDWGQPFKDGRAMVCRGCVMQAPDADGHQSLSGGEWGYINKDGEEIIPVKYQQNEAIAK
jgi:hypothetical protein